MAERRKRSWKEVKERKKTNDVESRGTERKIKRKKEREGADKRFKAMKVNASFFL